MIAMRYTEVYPSLAHPLLGAGNDVPKTAAQQWFVPAMEAVLQVSCESAEEY